MVRLFVAIKAIFKKVHHFLSSIINFTLIIPMYLIGAGLSRLLYRKKAADNEKEAHDGSYWKESSLDYGKDSFERLF
ncbi:MAG: hypothetical protein V1866_05515 [archaeon]